MGGKSIISRFIGKVLENKSVIIIAVLVILILGRMVGLPITLAIVNGSSMLPTLHPGDIIIGYKGEFRVGDIVIWYGNPLHGVVHRIYNISDEGIVTKGDNNPVPDPPIPINTPIYRVILIIPLYAWILPLAIALILYLYRNRDDLIEAVKGVEADSINIVYLVVITMLITDLFIIAFVPVNFFSPLTTIRKPNIELLRMVNQNQNMLVFIYNTVDLEIREVKNSWLLYGDIGFPLNSYTIPNQSSITIQIPEEIFRWLYSKSDNRHIEFMVEMNVTLDKGWLASRYTIPLNWRELQITYNQTSLHIYNPNPITFNITQVLIEYYDYENTTQRYIKTDSVEINDYPLPPNGEYTYIFKPKWDMIIIKVKYEFRFAGGNYVEEVKKIYKS